MRLLVMLRCTEGDFVWLRTRDLFSLSCSCNYFFSQSPLSFPQSFSLLLSLQHTVLHLTITFYWMPSCSSCCWWFWCCGSCCANRTVNREEKQNCLVCSGLSGLLCSLLAASYCWSHKQTRRMAHLMLMLFICWFYRNLSISSGTMRREPLWCSPASKR